MADEPQEKAPPFYERRWFAGAVAVVGLVGAIWVLSAKAFDTASQITAHKTKVVYANTQIILDTSEAMAAPFGRGTKLDAAVRSIEKYVVPRDQEGLSLRRTGRDCGDAGQRLVDFGTDHGDDVAAAAGELRPEGESSLAYAVIEAIKEFTASDRFEGPKSMQQVVIITGAGSDECLGDEAPDEIRRELENSGIDATFKMVSLKPSPREREQLRGFVAALGEHADLDFVDTEEELDDVVEQSMRVLPGEADERFQLVAPAVEETTEGEATEAEATEAETAEGETTDADEVTEEGEGVGAKSGAGAPGATELEGSSESGTEGGSESSGGYGAPPPSSETSSTPVEAVPPEP